MAESSDSGSLVQEYYRRTRHVSASWRLLGAMLGLQVNRLDVIEQENHSVDDRLMKMLVTWLWSNPENPEEKLDSALKEVRPVIQEGSTQEMCMTVNIQQKIARLKLEFTNIATKAFEVLKQQHSNSGSLTVWLNELLKGDLKEPLMCETIAVNHDELFLLLQKKWSFTNPDILEQLINYMDNKALQQSIKDYRKDYKSFCQSLQFSEKSLLEKGMQFSARDPSRPCLVLIIESGPMTLQEIYLFLDNVFGIYKRYMRVHKIEPGCIKVTLQFPLGMKKLIEACVDEKLEFTHQYGEVKIEEPETKTLTGDSIQLSH